MAKKSNAAKIRAYIVSNPKAKAAEIVEKFGVSLAYVYVLRSQVKKAVGKYMRPDGTLKQRLQSADAPPVPDMVNHPAHYKAGGIETIDFIEAKGLNYHLGNVVKYITRADLKGERLENLKKAKWYLDREIAQG